MPLSLKRTNILVNDPHYRKVDALWQKWLKYGHKRQETAQQRAARRQREAAAWDRFVLHLVVRGFAALGWSATPSGAGWALVRSGWSPVRVATDAMGVVRVDGERTLCLLPICADLAGADPDAVQGRVEHLDGADGEVVIAHVGSGAMLTDADRASGWSIGGRAVLFPCSPWGIDSEERMARLLHGWLCRAAAPAYPVATTLRALPEWPGRRDWLRHHGDHLVAFRAPTEREASEARAWAAGKARELDTLAQRAKAAKQAVAVAPREAVTAFQTFVDLATDALVGMDNCPVCGALGLVEPRPGKAADGSDATWWAMCGSCGSEWGTRPCTGCGTRYRALVPQTGLAASAAAEATPARDWPDKVFGRDLWAQPCSQGVVGQFRCPDCGACSGGGCARCSSRSAAARP